MSENNNIKINMNIHTSLTRYLYSAVEVKQSLLISLLQHNVSQALFWGYEYYYSGFEEDTFDFLKNIYHEIYAETNPTLEEYILELITEWENNDDNRYDCNIGSIIYTLALRSYNLVSFIKTYLNYKITNDESNIEFMPECLVRLLPEHIEKYKTVMVNVEMGEKAYNLLKTVKLYPIIKDHNNLFDTQIHTNFRDIYHYPFEKWLYYASNTPIWLERIYDHNGTINHDLQTVTFENEKDETEFCELWDYEQDELPSNIRELSLGTGIEKQLTMKQFCKKYKYTFVSKIVIRKVTKKSQKTG